jgi:CRISPR-associated protein Cmr2
MSHFFAFHIGPIQDFIATARRTQDLWIGSWMLAHLSRIAMDTATSSGAEMVLPKGLPLHEDPTIADTPNHFLARVDADVDPAMLADEVVAAVNKAWEGIHNQVKDVFFSNVNNNLWERQVNNFLEIYWAAVPDDGSIEARNHAQAALDARKRLRDFKFTEEKHLKCTLCGVRQELSGKAFIGRVTDDGARNWWTKQRQDHLDRPHLKKFRVRENERLCAVCAVKRGALQADAVSLKKEVGSFPSTSSVAAAMFKRRVIELIRGGKAQDELNEHLQRLKGIGIPDNKVEKNCIPKLASILEELPVEVRECCGTLLTFDGDLFYMETFTDKHIETEFPDAFAYLRKQAEQKVAKAQVAAEVSGRVAGAAARLHALYHAAEVPPSKYFAALMMDGDHMGRFFGKASTTEAQDLSLRMSRFARDEGRAIVEGNFGRLVYAGGDDVLALLPLETALSCAQDLQQKFVSALDGLSKPASVDLPTPSIGIAIAHHTQPLDATLTALRQAERAAKNVYNRNALCVYVLKRSGEEVHVGTHWQAGDDKVDAVKVVTDLVELLKQKVLSMRFPTMFAGEARFLPIDAIEAELRRVCNRQKGEQFEQHKQKVKKWLGRAAKLAVAIGAEEFANWALLARFIASGWRDEQ